MSKIDLTCPAEIFTAALPTEEIPAATLTLFNLSDRVITSVCCACWTTTAAKPSGWPTAAGP